MKPISFCLGAIVFLGLAGCNLFRDIDKLPSPACEPACGVYESCINKECVAGFSSIQIDLPASEEEVNSTFNAQATLTKREDYVGKTPPSLVMRAKAKEGDWEECPLYRDGDSSKYTGECTLGLSGGYNLMANLPELNLFSDPIYIRAIEGCNPKCNKQYHICLYKECVLTFQEIVINEPYLDQKYNAAIAIAAELVPKNGLKPELIPEFLQFKIKSNQQVLKTGTLNRKDKYSFTGSWEPPATGEQRYELVVSSAELEPLGLSPSSTHFVIDRQPPEIHVERDYPARNEMQKDELFGKAFRRDEVATIRIWSPDTDVNPDSAVFSISEKPELNNSLEECNIPVSGSNFCRQVRVSLWDLPMNEFRKKFAASVKVSDYLGNQKEEKFDIPVTRWKWQYKYSTQNAPETPTPAIGSNGDIYVGKYAFTPDLKDEKPKWDDSQIQSVQSIAIGKNKLGAERVFILGSETSTVASGKLWEVDFDKLSKKQELCDGGAPVGNIALSISYQNIAEAIPTIFAGFKGLASADSSQVIGVKLLEEGKCELVTSSAPSGGLVARGQSLFFGTDKGIVKQEQSNDVWSESWSRETSVSPQGLVATDTNLFSNLSNSIMIGDSKIARVIGPYSSESKLIEMETKNPISNLIVVKIGEENRVVYLHRNSTKTEVLSIPEDFETGTQPDNISTISGIVWSAPIIGEDKTLYVVAENSTLYAINDKTIIWQEKISNDMSLVKNYTLALDCNRDQNTRAVNNRPGVLYLSSNNGVTAVVVDSKGIDTTSPWPKIGRDPRNTFDSTLNLEEFNCKALARIE